MILSSEAIEFGILSGNDFVHLSHLAMMINHRFVIWGVIISQRIKILGKTLVHLHYVLSFLCEGFVLTGKNFVW